MILISKFFVVAARGNRKDMQIHGENTQPSPKLNKQPTISAILSESYLSTATNSAKWRKKNAKVESSLAMMEIRSEICDI